jgi:hypothetical protein
MNAFSKVCIILAFTVGFGWQLAGIMDRAAEQVAANFSHSERHPAEMSKDFDFSMMSGPALKKASHKRLMEDVRLIMQDDQVGVELGHFVVKNKDGDKKFACQYYDRVELKFAAQGMAVNGQVPYLVVEGKCQMSKKIDRIEPLWLPLVELKAMEPRNLRNYFFSEEKVFTSIYNVGDVWPQNWQLQAVRVFHQSENDREIAVEADSNDGVSETEYNHPIVIAW